MFLVEIWFPHSLEDGHGGERARAHSDVGELIGRAVGVDGVEADAGGIDTSDDEVSADVALVAEEILFEHGHACNNTGGSAGGERMEL